MFRYFLKLFSTNITQHLYGTLYIGENIRIIDTDILIISTCHISDELAYYSYTLMQSQYIKLICRGCNYAYIAKNVTVYRFYQLLLLLSL